MSPSSMDCAYVTATPGLTLVHFSAQLKHLFVIYAVWFSVSGQETSQVHLESGRVWTSVFSARRKHLSWYTLGGSVVQWFSDNITSQVDLRSGRVQAPTASLQVLHATGPPTSPAPSSTALRQGRRLTL